MGKLLKMQRNELIWETRVNYFGEKNWQRTLEWLKTFYDNKDTFTKYEWGYEHALLYERVKDLTFEEVIEDYNKYIHHEEDSIYVIVKKQRYDGDETWTYKRYLGEFIVEEMREDNADSDLYDTQYTGDSEEYIEIVEE